MAQKGRFFRVIEPEGTSGITPRAGATIAAFKIRPRYDDEVIRTVIVVAAILASACASTPAMRGSGAIAGRVVNADGAPIEGVRVILQAVAAPKPVLSDADPMVRTDAQGRFSFDAPRAGRHQLLLLHPTLGWLIAQGAEPGPPLRLIFDGKARVIDVTRRK